MMSLSFDGLRRANMSRTEDAFHAIDDWSPTDWATAMAGECGECCNVVKKMRRLQSHPNWQPGDADLDLTRMAGDELADLIIYADLLAARLGINLGECLVRKFNEVSVRIGSPVRLGGES